MGLALHEVLFRKPFRAIGSIGLALTAAAMVGGCVVRVEERPVYVRPVPPPRAEVVVEQPVVTVEPVAAVVYEPAPVEVVTVYESDLGPYGHWVDVAPYGRCWVWNGRHADWRPYTVGHWVESDQGWLWVSEGDEAAWGASCYHYGRWFEDPTYGWVWVPGSVWAPSWCAWRTGGDYTCWAPLPPECGDGHVISVEVVDRYCPASRFYCVETRNMVNINIRENVIVNNITIVNQTTNVTNITYVNNRAVNRGVDVKIVEKATGHAIKVERAARVTSPEEARKQIAAGHPVIYAPKAIETFHKAHPVAKGIPHKDAAHEEHKPVVEEKRPPEKDEHKPIVEEKKPIEKEEHKPVVEEKKPVEKEEHAPVKEEKKPVVEEKKPEVRQPEVNRNPEEKKPVVEPKKPAPEERKPEVNRNTTNKPTDPKKPKPGEKPDEQK